MRCIAFIPLAFLFAAIIPRTEAREWVVNQANARTSDSNRGTANEPLKSISAATTKVKPGDHIIVHGGTYREVVNLHVSGTPEAPITIEAVAGETPIIKGSDVITGWTVSEGAIWKAKLAPTARPTTWQTKDVRQVFTRDGVLFEGERLARVTQREQMTEGTFLSDANAGLLFVWLPGSASPNEHPPEASVRGAWLNVEANHIVIRGFQMRHASTTAIANWPACNLKGDDITLENCQITWGDFVGLSVNGSHIRVRNSLIACHGAAGMGGTGEDNLIEGCRVVYNNVSRYDPNWHAGGAKLIPNFRHSIVRHNEFAHNLGPGLWLDTGCDDNVLDGNITHDNEGPGIIVEISRYNLVSNNLSYANRNFLSGPYRNEKGEATERSMSEDRIAPSRFFKPYHAGDGRGIYVSSAPGTKVLHNTVYLNEGEGVCVEGPPRPVGGVDYRTRDYVVANNISVFNKGSQLTLRGAEGTEKIPCISDYNCLFAVGAVLAKYGWNGPAALTLPDWQKASGQDAHSLDADPHFAAPAMDDFRLLASSPVLQAGQPFPEASSDFLGRARDLSRPALGAFEKVAARYPAPAWESLSSVIRCGSAGVGPANSASVPP